MLSLFKRAIQDIRKNVFLNSVTIVTIAMSILITSAFVLFFVNASEIMNAWKKEIRMMAYLKPDAGAEAIADLQVKITSMYGVREARYIPREEAINRLKEQLKEQAFLFAGLEENPLPNAFEILVDASTDHEKEMHRVAEIIEGLPAVETVEFGRQWFKRFTNIFNLFRLAGYAMGGLFFMAAIFIVANTIRLMLYSRREEVEIMRLVGATDGFIKAPFYIEGLIQGALGGGSGVLLLFIIFIFLSAKVQEGAAGGLFTIQFLSIVQIVSIILGSTLIGLMGCFFSLKQYFRNY